MKRICLLTAVSFWAVISLAQPSNGFRGPSRNGIYSEKGLLTKWSAEGPKLLWETSDVGKGYSSPVVADDRLYITGLNENGDREVFSVYTLDGKKVYETVYGEPWNQTYPESRTTPSIEGNRAYIVSGMGDVVCIDVTNGNIVWEVSRSKFGIKYGKFGMAESLLVFDNQVIFTPCGDQTTMIALNAATGETVWTSESLNDFTNYVSPILITHHGKRQIIGITGKYVIGVHPETGKIEWKFSDWGRDYKRKITPDIRLQSSENICPNPPLYDNGCLFITSGSDLGGFMLQLNDNASDVTLVWRNDDLDTHIGGFVLVDGTIYGSNWIDNNKGNWMAVDWKTGITKYETSWGGGRSKGSIIFADNMLYCYDELRGYIGLVKPDPEKFGVVSEFRITKGDGPHWAHPVIHNGVLYIRHGSVLMAYQIK